ncbi:MAG: hypothetical protein GWP68_06965 [Verrucomicrobiaceae bacterium]|jgi:hypothetical protein|nr:hypothetical protein [Verrucomicrobiaceae bacterium]
MHLRFTDDELSTLSEMLTLACWATFWNHKPGADEGVARFDDMLEKILSRMQHHGLGGEVENDPERQRLRLRKDKEESSFYAQCYDEMRSETFWEELVVRMTDRELNKRHGKAVLEAMSEAERKVLAEPISKRYWQEFTSQGLDNLHVISRQNAG